MTDADKVMNTQHYGSNPADVRIRIWINLEIPDQFRLRFWPWRRFALSEHCLVVD